MWLGEIISQTGDAMAALQLYQRVALLDPGNPLPYLNASRIYQQIKLQKEAYTHMQLAIQIDDQLSMTQVDLAQYYLHSGQVQLAMQTLEEAFVSARHVSEIKDVVTARTVAVTRLALQSEGF